MLKPGPRSKGDPERISTLALVLFALPIIPTIMLAGPLGAILPGYYATHTAATLASIGTALLIARVVDAVSDPVIGYLSDRTRSRFGRRKPWIIAGAVLAILCVRYLFVPPPDANATYFFTWALMGYVAWGMIFIPYNAWASELSGQYDQRSRIFAIRNMVGGIGGIAFALAPLALSPITGTTELNDQALSLVAWGVVILLPLTILLAFRWSPEAPNVATEENSMRGLLGAVRTIRPLWTLLLTSIINGVAGGISLSIYFLVLDSYLKLGSYISILVGAGVIVNVLSVPIWLRITYRFGKHRPWAISMLLSILALPLLLALKPGPSAFVPFLLLSIWTGFMTGCTLVAPSAMLADVVDYDVLKSGVNRTGNYFAFLIMIGKLNFAVGGAIAFFTVGLFGYDPQGTNDALAAFGLLFAYAGLPGILWLLSGVLAWRFPLDARRQRIIRRRIEKRAERALVAEETSS